MSRKKEVPPKPPGCKACKGDPWLVSDAGVRRCDCPRGVWFRQREREHLGRLTPMDWLPLRGGRVDA